MLPRSILVGLAVAGATLGTAGQGLLAHASRGVRSDTESVSPAAALEAELRARGCGADCEVHEVKWIDPTRPGRTRQIDPDIETLFAGLGRTTCTDPADGSRFVTQMALVGNRSTASGTGHFLGRDHEPHQCVFELFRPDGTVFFRSPLKSVATALPVEVYQRSNDGSLINWSVVQLADPAPLEVRPFRVALARPIDLAEARNVFIVTLWESAATGSVVKAVTPDLSLQPVEFSPNHFAHDGNTISENEGAFLFSLRDDEPIAVGVNVGSLDTASLNLAQFFLDAHLDRLPAEAEAPDLYEPIVRRDPLAGIPNLEITYYDVRGRTFDEIRAEVNRLRPRDPTDGQGVAAVNRWYMAWRWPGDGRGSCDLSRTELRFTATLVMPRLVDVENTEPEAVARWNAFVAALERHEGSHLRHAYENMGTVLDAIRASTCETANDVGRVAVRKLAEWDVDYDGRTRHGMDEGARY